jgi:hypothetical protein
MGFQTPISKSNCRGYFKALDFQNFPEKHSTQTQTKTFCIIEVFVDSTPMQIDSPIKSS